MLVVKAIAGEHSVRHVVKGLLAKSNILIEVARL